MGSLDQNAFLQLVSKSCIAALREMADKKIAISPEALADILGSRGELDMVSETGALRQEDGDLASDLQELTARYDRIRQQKDKLLRDYVSLEEKGQEADRFYRRVLLLFAEMQKGGGDDALDASADRFRKMVRDSAGIEVLDKGFSDLKERVFKSAGVSSSSKEKGTGSFFRKLLRDDRSNGDRLITTLRESLQDLVDNLRLNLDAAYTSRIRKLNDALGRADNPDDFLLIRRDIIDLISDYIARVHDEREEAASVIREIARRLMEMEELVLSAFMRQVRADADANQTFSSALERHLAEMDQSADFSQTLAELKEAVVTKLNTIQQVINKKRSEDDQRRGEAESRYKNLQEGLSRMRGEIAEANEKSRILEEELLRDPLTEAYNRRAYDRRIAEEMNRYLRYGSRFSVLIFDVDHFKKVNDRYGHAVGDKCLRAIIERVQPLLRGSDFLARFGGEEFVVLLPETEAEGAREVAEKLRHAVETIAFYHKEQQVQVTISIGGTMVREGDTGYDTVFTRMDKALYDAKNSGRNRVVMD